MLFVVIVLAGAVWRVVLPVVYQWYLALHSSPVMPNSLASFTAVMMLLYLSSKAKRLKQRRLSVAWF